MVFTLLQSQTRSQSTACLVSLAAVVLAGAKQALALEDGNVASTGLSLTNPEVMYAIFAIEAIALIGAAVGGIELDSCSFHILCCLNVFNIFSSLANLVVEGMRVCSKISSACLRLSNSNCDF